MNSLDIDLLFTNIHLDETTDICTNTIYSQSFICNRRYQQRRFRNLLSLAYPILFLTRFYINKRMELQWVVPRVQQSQMPFFVFYERKWLEKCPLEFQPVFCRRYVDDIFVLIKSTNHLKNFC